MSETGIYIRVGKENVLLENLDEIERTLWLQSLSENGLIRTVNRCCDVIGDFIVNYQHLQTNWKKLNKWLEEEIYNIEPKGTAINYNCEYDSEEDYINAMKERSKLITLKRILIQMQEIESGKNE